MKRVTRVEGNKNLVHLEDGTTVEYDVLALDVGSRTRGTYTMPGVQDKSLTTRPINELLPKIEQIEQTFVD